MFHLFFMDTSPIHIRRVSAAYRYPIHIGYVIRISFGVSEYRSLFSPAQMKASQKGTPEETQRAHLPPRCTSPYLKHAQISADVNNHVKPARITTLFDSILYPPLP